MFESAIRGAIYTALDSDSDLSEKVVGVYDHVPQAADSGDASAFPYVVIGDNTLTAWDTDLSEGAEATITVHSWSRYRGRKEIAEIHDLIYKILHRADSLPVSGSVTVGCDLDGSDVFLDSDGKTYHGVQRYRLIVDGAPTPAPSCSIVLTGDAAASFGVSSASIDGQRFFVDAGAAGLYLASTAIPGGSRAMPSSGRVWIRPTNLTADAGASVSPGIVGFDADGNAVAAVYLRLEKDGNMNIVADSPAGNEIAATSIGAFGFLGIASNGDVAITVDGETVAQGADIQTAFAGLFSTATAIGLLGSVNLDLGGLSASAEYVTSQAAAGWDAQLPTTDQDWCGQEIGA